jgi:hypothetical protein
MKRINIIAGIVIVIAFGIAAQASFGQSTTGLKFTTEFDFYVQGDKFAAGSYTAERRYSAMENHTLAIRSEDGKLRKVYILAPPSSQPSRSSGPLVTFFRFGGEYHLSELRNPRRGFSARIPGSRRERVRAREISPRERIAIAARLDR